MRDPVPCVRLTVQSRALDIDVLVLRVEVDVSDRGRFVGLLVLDADLLEEGRGDEVDILAWIGEEPEQAEDGEGGHGTTIIVARETCIADVEAGGDVWRGQWPFLVMMLQ